MARGLVGKGQTYRGVIKVSKKGASKEGLKAFEQALSAKGVKVSK